MTPYTQHARRLSRLVSSAAAIAFLSSAATAQTAPNAAADKKDEYLEEIIVTVERREQSLQDLAGTAAVFSGEDLRRLGVQKVTDLNGRFPGLQIGNNQGNIEVFIRGIGSTNNTELGDPAAATHLDGVYIPRPTGFGSAFFDIARVEVNIGPQGTLRGRNATAGSVNIISHRPGLNIFDAAAEIEYGNYDQTVLQGVVNVPVGDKVALRFAGYSLDHDSYYKNVGPTKREVGVAEAEDNLGFRAQILYAPNDDWSFLLGGDLIKENGTGYTGTNYANPLGQGIKPSDIKDPREVIARAFTPIQDTDHNGVKAEVKYKGRGFNVEYLASYRDLVYDYEAATPLSPNYPGVLNILQPAAENFDNFSRFRFITDSESLIQELRVASAGSGPLQWNLGAFYFKEDQRAFLGATGDRSLFFSGLEFNQPDVDTESYAFYGESTYSFRDDWRVTGGLRYSDDEKSRVGVNARYGFAIGGDGFSCCGGVRVGTEGFQFAGHKRTIFNPDTNKDGRITDQEILDFYFNGVAQFGVRDNVDDIFRNGPVPGDTPADRRPACLDTVAGDFFNCAPDGRVTFAVPFPGQINLQKGGYKDNFVDWRIRLEHDVTADNLVYGLVSTGHKSGGFNDTFNLANVPVSPTYKTEKVTLFELGSKNTFDVKGTGVIANVSAFYNDYKDQVLTSLLSVGQIIEFNGITVDPELVTQQELALVVSNSFNASDSEIYGMQFDGGLRLDHNINIDWTLLWLEAKVTKAADIQDFRFQADVAPTEAVNQSISGRRLPRTPRFQLNAKVSQSFDAPSGSFDYVLSMGWRSKQFLTIFNSIDFQNPDNPRLRLNDTVRPYFTADFGVGYSHGDSDKVRLEAYVNNITDQQREAALLITQFDNTRFFTRPRTFGARMRLRM
jgi:iron complex outermembrane recepter protein